MFSSKSLHCRIRFVAAVILGGLVAATPYGLMASDHVEWVVEYETGDPAPEGVAVDKRGNIYVSLNNLGQVHKLSPDGSWSVLIDFGPHPSPPSGPLGLAVDAPGNVYLTMPSFNPATHGVYRISRAGVGERLPGSQNIAFPNSLAFDQRGNLYVTDSFGGAVWRISPGGEAEPWIQHPLLAPIPPNRRFGPNGIAYRHRTVFVANTAYGHIVSIPVEPDGSPGTPVLVAEDLGVADGIALDVHGDIYVVDWRGRRLLRVDCRDGEVTILATAADGLDGPASLAFGTGKGHRQAVFVTNFAPAAWGGQRPGVLRVRVDAPGLPLP